MRKKTGGCEGATKKLDISGAGKGKASAVRKGRQINVLRRRKAQLPATPGRRAKRGQFLFWVLAFAHGNSYLPAGTHMGAQSNFAGLSGIAKAMPCILRIYSKLTVKSALTGVCPPLSWELAKTR